MANSKSLSRSRVFSCASVSTHPPWFSGTFFEEYEGFDLLKLELCFDKHSHVRKRIGKNENKFYLKVWDR